MTKEQETLVFDNAGLVKTIAKNYVSSAKTFTYEDLCQYGYEGLINAALYYNEDHNTKFSTYAYRFIDGYIKNAINKYDRLVRVPSRVKEHAVNYLNNYYENKKDVSDYCKGKGIPTYFVLQALHAMSETVYLDRPATSEEDNESLGMFLEESTPMDAPIMFEEVRFCLQTLFETNFDMNLKDREIQVLRLLYGFDREPLTMKKTGEELGISSERVRQIKDKALEKIFNKYKNKQLSYCMESCNEYDFSSY